eukprot:gene3723-4644_t
MQFSLSDLTLTVDEYQDWMSLILDEVSRVGEIMTQNDLAVNLLYWSSWSYNQPTSSNGGDSNQVVVFTGDASIIMDQNFIQGTIANANLDCPVFLSQEQYDKANAYIQMSLPVFYLDTNQVCNGIVDQELLGYNAAVTGDQFVVKLDVQALFSALSVNFKVKGPSSISYFTTTKVILSSVTYDGVALSMVEKFDSNYPGRGVMTCVGP